MSLGKRGTCKLCLEVRELRKSHIFPRSYLKFLKRESGQLIKVVVDKTTKPIKSNSDPKENLFCQEHELFLSENYEKYGTRFLKGDKMFEETPNFILYKNFKYETFYLFLISILWRSSISTLEDYSSVNLGQEFNELLRTLILNRTIDISPDMRIDHFIKVAVLKVIDKSGKLSQDIINKAFLNINFERGKRKQDGILYYFMIDGHLICYYLYPVKGLRKNKIHKLFLIARDIYGPFFNSRNTNNHVFQLIHSGFS